MRNSVIFNPSVKPSAIIYPHMLLLNAHNGVWVTVMTSIQLTGLKKLLRLFATPAPCQSIDSHREDCVGSCAALANY